MAGFHFNFLSFLSALQQEEGALLQIPVVAMSPAGKIISLAFVGEEIVASFLQVYHQNALAASTPATPAANPVPAVTVPNHTPAV